MVSLVVPCDLSCNGQLHAQFCWVLVISAMQPVVKERQHRNTCHTAIQKSVQTEIIRSKCLLKTWRAGVGGGERGRVTNHKAGVKYEVGQEDIVTWLMQTISYTLHFLQFYQKQIVLDIKLIKKKSIVCWGLILWVLWTINTVKVT